MLQRHAVRLHDVARVVPEALPRDLEGTGARAFDPVVGVHVERLLPPAEPEIRVEGAEPARVVDDLGALPAGRHGVRRGNGRCRGRAEPEHERRCDQRAPDASTRPLGQRTAESDRDDERHDAGADEREHAEDGAVGYAVRAQRHVLGQRRPRERPRPDERRRAGRRHEDQPARQALAADEKPQREDDHADDDSCAREREQQRERRDVHEQRAGNPNASADGRARVAEPEAEHDRDVREKRERVPVADRLAQTRDAVAFGIE